MGDHDAPSTWWERWRETEPVRLYVYGVTIPGLGLATAYGWVTQVQAVQWLAVAGAALGATVAGTELARRTAWSPHSVDTALDEADLRGYSAGRADVQDPDWRSAATKLPATTAMRSLGRCRRVQDGLRCLLPAHPEAVPHKYE